MILLLIHLLEAELTTQDLFGEFIFVQSVKRQTGKDGDRKMIQSDLVLIQADDFFAKLKKEEIIKSDQGFDNLKSYLGLNTRHTSVLLVKKIKKTLEIMY